VLVQLDQDRSKLVDAVVSAYLAEHPELPEHWVLEQALYTGPSWRALLGMLQVESAWHVLDVGTGFGVMALELAAQGVRRVTAVDHDAAKLDVARQLASDLAAEGALDAAWDAGLRFERAEASGLPFDDEAFDLALARLLYQHLDDPVRVSEELCRVLRPGGFACVWDVDDQLSLLYPEVSDAFSRLHAAFVELGRRRGEDRYVGRKLATYLDQAGFDIVAVLVWPQAAYGPSRPDDLARRFDVGRLRRARAAILKEGIMSAEDFDACIELYATEETAAQFTSSAQIVVLGRRPS
jgi:ubiquinone/menaquinone biosynthesis C-methylase UbiE